MLENFTPTPKEPPLTFWALEQQKKEEDADLFERALKLGRKLNVTKFDHFHNKFQLAHLPLFQSYSKRIVTFLLTTANQAVMAAPARVL